MLLGFRGAKREPQKNMKTPPMTMLGHYETEKKAAGVVTTTAAATTTKNKQKTKNKQTNKQQQTTNKQQTAKILDLSPVQLTVDKSVSTVCSSLRPFHGVAS